MANFRQLLVNPRTDTASELQTTSIFGPFELKCQRSIMGIRYAGRRNNDAVMDGLVLFEKYARFVLRNSIE